MGFFRNLFGKKPSGSGSAPSEGVTIASVPGGEVKCPACGRIFTPPRITLASQDVIARYGPNPTQCPDCRHIWSR